MIPAREAKCRRSNLAFLAKTLNQNTPNTCAGRGAGAESGFSHCQPRVPRAGCRRKTRFSSARPGRGGGAGLRGSGGGASGRAPRGQWRVKSRGNDVRTCQGRLVDRGGGEKLLEQGVPEPDSDPPFAEGASFFKVFTPTSSRGGAWGSRAQCAPLSASCDCVTVSAHL